jgi:hypothetical protein
MSSQEHAAAEFSLRSRVAELEVTNHNLAQERSGLLARANPTRLGLRARMHGKELRWLVVCGGGPRDGQGSS